MRVSLRRVGTSRSAGAGVRAVALVALATLNAALSAATTHPLTVAAPAASQAVWADRPLAEVLLAPTPTAPAPTRPAAPVHKARAKAKAAAKAKPLAPHGRYIPTGTGMWTYMWSQTEHGNARYVVARAKSNGLSHIYVRTGTRVGGFDGGPVLKELLPATKGTNIKVIAWDFPTLANPVADAHRLAAAARFTVKGAPRVAAVAPDIETGSEGTKLSAARVDQYMRTLRTLLPWNVAIIGVTPWPSEHRVGKYPYANVARYSDALAPMAYWINRDPATVARQSMQRLRVFKKPVLPIGQAYDPRIDVPSLSLGPPSRAQVVAFLHTAKKYGAPSASLWVWQFASRDQWSALHAARPMFPIRK